MCGNECERERERVYNDVVRFEGNVMSVMVMIARVVCTYTCVTVS